MRVKQRLAINTVVTVASAITVLVVLLVAVHGVIRAAEATRVADGIITGAFERVTLRTDYLRTGSERAREQVRAKHEEIGKLLISASEKFTAPEDKRTVEALRKGHKSIGNNFRAVVENRKIAGLYGRSAELSREIEDRLLSQLNMRVYEMVLLGGKLQESSEEALTSAIRLAGGAIAVVLLLAGAVSLINSRIMDRAITDRIRRLRDGAAVIGGGNLNHRIDLAGDDEFSDLSASFNAMTAKLRISYENMTARNVELEFLNKELEAFIYSISHDLRAPIRSMASFAKFLVEDYADKLDGQGRDYLTRINRGAEKMSRLIEDLLRLSKISRQEIIPEVIDLSKMASSISESLRDANPERNVAFSIQQGLTADADARLMEITLSNLLENAWKFTSVKEKAHIDFGSFEKGGKTVYYVSDDGAGFDQNHVEKIFWPFQRLHPETEFAGTGIGLSIVERIIHRHGGRIWAEGQAGKGATIYFTLK